MRYFEVHFRSTVKHGGKQNISMVFKGEGRNDCYGQAKKYIRDFESGYLVVGLIEVYPDEMVRRSN